MEPTNVNTTADVTNFAGPSTIIAASDGLNASNFQTTAATLPATMKEAVRVSSIPTAVINQNAAFNTTTINGNQFPPAFHHVAQPTMMKVHAEKPPLFNGQDFKRWQQKMLFYLTTLSLAHILKEVCPEIAIEDMSFETIVARENWVVSKKQKSGEGGAQRVWRRRKLTKRDDMSHLLTDRTPFLEEQVRKIKDQGKLVTMDIERLLLSEDNRFDFVNEVAAEAKEYVENNRDEYGGSKKAILHVLSNRVNDTGFYRPDAYVEDDPYKPGPHYLREEFT